MKKKTKRKRSKLSTVIVWLLLLSGIGVMLYPSISDALINYQLSREIAQYNTALDGVVDDYSDYWEPAEEYNQYLLTKDIQLTVSPEENDYVRTLLNPLNTGMLGAVEIPKIGVNIPIFFGTDEKQLQSGAGYWLGSSLPTGGEDTHTVLTAHTGLVRAKLFTDIDKLENGDIIRIKVLDRLLSYEVEHQEVIEPDDMDPLYIQPGRDLVTLYTCYPYGVNTHRLIVRGHRIPNEEAVETTEEIIESWLKYKWVYLLPLLLLLPIAYWLARRRKKKKAKKAKKAALVPMVDVISAPERKLNPGWVQQIPVRLRKMHLKYRVMTHSDTAAEKMETTKEKILQKKTSMPMRRHKQKSRIQKRKQIRR